MIRLCHVHGICPAMAVLLSSMLAGMVGCGGSSEVPRYPVSGRVAFDGEPVASGTITFNPKGEGPSSGGEIKDGAYDVPAEKGPVAGPHNVVIQGFRKTGKQIPADEDMFPGVMVDEVKPFIPAAFNTKTTLTAEIEPGDNADTDFLLESDDAAVEVRSGTASRP